MKHKLYVLMVALAAASLFLSACGGATVAASSLPRNTNPQASVSDIQELTAGNTAFAFDLYQQMRRGDNPNLVYSPYSISLAFAMTYAGARGETATQMAQAMHYTLAPERLHPAFNALSLDLDQRSLEVEGVEEADRFQLSLANSLWGQKNWSFLPDYLDLLATHYGAGMRLVDFESAPEAARRQINDWVSDQTQKRIRNMIPPGMIDPLTRFVLVNAIYFKATWQFEFDPDKTADRPFYLLNGQTVNVPMMSVDQATPFSYAAGEGWQAVALPYKGGLVEMIVIVPDQGTFEAFEAEWTAERYNQIVSALQPQMVRLSMPKFKFDNDHNLVALLTTLGMHDAFDPNRADFSGIDGKRDLYITTALHKAFIATDEKGTEAAAATTIIIGVTSMPIDEGILLTIDRPFFYVIRDVPTGTILFMGRVLDPTHGTD
ncbi:MAG: serpin family protein [Anaerolineales bacterium]|nr:serpin family protein [Anaerolineales bacterium]